MIGYIHQQRQDRFRREGKRLPFIHHWDKYTDVLVPVTPNDDGSFTYSSRHLDGETAQLVLPINAEEVEDGEVPLGDMLERITPSSYDLFAGIIMTANPDFYSDMPLDLTHQDVRADDVIHTNSGDYFVYSLEDGSLEVVRAEDGEHLPGKMLEMFHRRGIHSQVDLVDLYGDDASEWSRIALANGNFLRIAPNEHEYDRHLPGYYFDDLSGIRPSA